MARHPQSRPKHREGDDRSVVRSARHVVIVGVPPVRSLDVFGPAEVFGDANRLQGGDPSYRVTIISACRERLVPSYIENLCTAIGAFENVVDHRPWAAVAVDVAMLRAIPALPGEWLVSGLVYEVATGLVEIVVPPARVRGTVQSVNSQPSTSKSWFLLVSCDPMIRFYERRWIMTLCIKPSVAIFTSGGTLCE